MEKIIFVSMLGVALVFGATASYADTDSSLKSVGPAVWMAPLDMPLELFNCLDENALDRSRIGCDEGGDGADGEGEGSDAGEGEGSDAGEGTSS